MGERADDMRRDPLDEGTRDTDPLASPIGRPGAVRTAPGPDPALGGGAVADEAEVERDEIERSRAEIERTRAEMGETVDAIQQKLSPENLKEQAKDRVRETTVGRAMETVRENPLPAALTGIGLGWLFMSARKRSSGRVTSRDEAYYSYDYSPSYGYPPRYEGQEVDGPSNGQALERARDRVGETASQAQDKAGQVASQAQNQVSRLGDQAQYRTRRAGEEFQRVLRENPLTVGAIVAGVGAAIGLALPETGKENEVMGEARDTFVEKAQEKVQETQEKVQRVTEEAQSAAKEEAENQGLTQD